MPAESKKVAFELMAAPPRPLTVRVLDGAGRVRATLDKAREGHIVNIDREPTVEKEVWLLEVLECGDNGFFDQRDKRTFAPLMAYFDSCGKFGIIAA